MYFVGIDLAWSKEKNTGIAISEGNRDGIELCYYNKTASNEDILNTINNIVEDKNAIITIDAPLIVPNETGRRRPEQEISSQYGKYWASAHSSNRQLFTRIHGCIRGEELSHELELMGYSQDPYLSQCEEEKKFFEVYPHPAMVVLFELDKILQYKQKSNRSYETRWDSFQTYQSKMKTLEGLKPSPVLSEVLDKDVNGLIGNELKNYEDILDAVFCSYLAYYTWANPEKCHVFGNMNEGYICTPIK
ncbi:MAG: hypothetical protein PWQ63_240 [Methanolobus sp.]|jgi:predicted RNase H-like nuclease|nr:hypothetical protein [Methanolobus sp.]